jgi:hypothetical protein
VGKRGWRGRRREGAGASGHRHKPANTAAPHPKTGPRARRLTDVLALGAGVVVVVALACVSGRDDGRRQLAGLRLGRGRRLGGGRRGRGRGLGGGRGRGHSRVGRVAEHDAGAAAGGREHAAGAAVGDHVACGEGGEGGRGRVRAARELARERETTGSAVRARAEPAARSGPGAQARAAAAQRAATATHRRSGPRGGRSCSWQSPRPCRRTRCPRSRWSPDPRPARSSSRWGAAGEGGDGEAAVSAAAAAAAAAGRAHALRARRPARRPAGPSGGRSTPTRARSRAQGGPQLTSPGSRACAP